MYKFRLIFFFHLMEKKMFPIATVRGSMVECEVRGMLTKNCLKREI